MILPRRISNMENKMMHPPIMPIAPRPSQYGIEPALVKRRVAEMPGMVSLKLKELFPDLPDVIYPGPEDALEKLYEVAKEELRKVDMSMIQPDQSVNVLASHHGFTLFGGQPYAILLKAIRDVIIEKTGCRNIRLRDGQVIEDTTNPKILSAAEALAALPKNDED